MSDGVEEKQNQEEARELSKKYAFIWAVLLLYILLLFQS